MEKETERAFGLKYGAITGIATIFYMLAFYLIGQKVMLHHLVFWSTIIIYLIGMFTAVFTARKKVGGIEFKSGLRIAFQTFIVANVFWYIFYYAMLNWIDPELITLQKEMMEANFQLNQQNEEQLKMLRESNFDFTIRDALFSFAKDAITGFILSLLIAGITRNK